MTMTELYKPFIVMHVTLWDFWLLRKSRMKAGKEPHAAREPRVGHTCNSSSYAVCITKMKYCNLHNHQKYNKNKR